MKLTTQNLTPFMILHKFFGMVFNIIVYIIIKEQQDEIFRISLMSYNDFHHEL